jgi:hypothetical protein
MRGRFSGHSGLTADNRTGPETPHFYKNKPLGLSISLCHSKNTPANAALSCQNTVFSQDIRERRPASPGRQGTTARKAPEGAGIGVDTISKKFAVQAENINNFCKRSKI